MASDRVRASLTKRTEWTHSFMGWLAGWLAGWLFTTYSPLIYLDDAREETPVAPHAHGTPEAVEVLVVVAAHAEPQPHFPQATGAAAAAAPVEQRPQLLLLQELPAVPVAHPPPRRALAVPPGLQGTDQGTDQGRRKE